MRLTLVTGPTEEPLSVDEAREHLRSDPDDDTYVALLVSAVREVFEMETGRQLMTATWRLKLDAFPKGREPIELPRAPLQSVTSVTYLDTDGVTQTWSDTEYTVDAPAGDTPLPGRVYPSLDENYPTVTGHVPDAVTIEYVAGYESRAVVPDGIKATLLLMIGDLYENREGQVTGSIITQNPTMKRLLHRYRVPVLA